MTGGTIARQTEEPLPGDSLFAHGTTTSMRGPTFIVTVNDTGATAMFGRISSAFEDLSMGKMRDGFERAGDVYLSSMRARFDREGDGTWVDLAPLTVTERIELGFPGQHPILKRLGVLEEGLLRGAPGNLFEHFRDGVAVGYGGDALHPGYTGKDGEIVGGNVPIAEIAATHQRGRNIGLAHVPARPILVPPDSETRRIMRAAIENAVALTIQEAKQTKAA